MWCCVHPQSHASAYDLCRYQNDTSHDRDRSCENGGDSSVYVSVCMTVCGGWLQSGERSRMVLL
jgi:hypothetical protein